MKIHFHVRYRTKLGENILVSGDCTELREPQKMKCLSDEFWHFSIEIDSKKAKKLVYKYHFEGRDGLVVDEWGDDRRLDFADFSGHQIQCVDFWNPAGAVENAFFTQPFRISEKAATAPKSEIRNLKFSHLFRIKMPLLASGERLVLLGEPVELGGWATEKAVVLEPNGDWLEAKIDLSKADFPVAYKYAVVKKNGLFDWELGENRLIYDNGIASKTTVLHDGFAKIKRPLFRGAGVAIPVFSLRSEASFGVGEFTDLRKLADWGASVGLKLIQLLPINDTSSRMTWEDSYPYAPISCFALHPIYLNIFEAAGKKNAAIVRPFLAKQKALNDLPELDYEAVLTEKWKAIKLLFEAEKANFLTKTAEKAWFSKNENWLKSYAAFCFLKEKHGTADFSEWPKNDSTFDEKRVEKLFEKTSPDREAVLLHVFAQWLLHEQLAEAVDYCHSKNLVLKGDLPIGIYRFSADAWVAPHLYNMDSQAGAPPDDFAEAGQNWGFPTYRWDAMKADGFAWWRQRFEQMAVYFDAFRIDHILGFFRIWSIPMDAVEGILGRFVPCLPVKMEEFWQNGIPFDHDRLCAPFITTEILNDLFGAEAEAVAAHFLERRMDGRWAFQPQFSTQKSIEAFFDNPSQTLPRGEGFSVDENPKTILSSKEKKAAKIQQTEKPSPRGRVWEGSEKIKKGLFSLVANVLLFERSDGSGFDFRIKIEKTASFQALSAEMQGRLAVLSHDYFYKRQDEFWRREAMEKLPALKKSTPMLICGEDLGMLNDSVATVMQDLGLLSLEIQRMPKDSRTEFFHPKDAPYLSVVTPSTHDMSIIRGWWEEERETRMPRFWSQFLGQSGPMPYFCEPWICRILIDQHLKSPAMWAIFQLQELMAIDGDLRREDPREEQINVPANSRHYWRYRMHLTLEALGRQAFFNRNLGEMISGAGR